MLLLSEYLLRCITEIIFIYFCISRLTLCKKVLGEELKNYYILIQGMVEKMALREQRYSVLIVSASEKFNTSMASLLPESSFVPVITEKDASSARRRLVENHPDIVIINTPLPDDFGIGFALDVCESSGTAVLLFVKAEHYPELSARLSPSGVLVLSKPTSAQMITQSLQLLCGTRERLRKMEQKTASVEEKMKEIRVINRAKCLLIEQLKMTEKEAHRYIEKQAMDTCATRYAVAENILATYGS